MHLSMAVPPSERGIAQRPDKPKTTRGAVDPNDAIDLEAMASPDKRTRDAAWSNTVNNLGRRVHRDARRTIGSTPTSEEYQDAAQDAWLAVFENTSKGRYEGPNNLVRSLQQIVRNKAVDITRRPSYDNIFESTLADEYDDGGDKSGPFEQVGDPNADFEQDIDARESYSPVVKHALSNLSDELREVAYLSIAVGLSHKEIAELLNISPGASRVALHRALTKAREALGVKGKDDKDSTQISQTEESHAQVEGSIDPRSPGEHTVIAFDQAAVDDTIQEGREEDFQYDETGDAETRVQGGTAQVLFQAPELGQRREELDLE